MSTFIKSECASRAKLKRWPSVQPRKTIDRIRAFQPPRHLQHLNAFAQAILERRIAFQQMQSPLVVRHRPRAVVVHFEESDRDYRNSADRGGSARRRGRNANGPAPNIVRASRSSPAPVAPCVNRSNPDYDDCDNGSAYCAAPLRSVQSPADNASACALDSPDCSVRP